MTWTADRRERQRVLIQTWKPWEKSTGARTLEGKARVSKNAIKSGFSLGIRARIKIINQLLDRQRMLIEKR